MVFFVCIILTLVCSLRTCHMWWTRNHMFIREIWGKFTLFIFWNFEISLVSLKRFQNFKKVNSVNLSQIFLLNMWLLVLICCIFSEHPFLWTPLDSCFCCIPTLQNQSFILHESKLNLSHNGWFFAKYVLFICCLLQLKPSLHYFHCYVIFSYRKYLTAMQWFRAGNV